MISKKLYGFHFTEEKVTEESVAGKYVQNIWEIGHPLCINHLLSKHSQHNGTKNFVLS
jgi:hypothetical protein